VAVDDTQWHQYYLNLVAQNSRTIRFFKPPDYQKNAGSTGTSSLNKSV
jgi:hypothetical protein